MAIFISGVDLLKTVVSLIGGGMVCMGLIQFFQGQSESNAAAKQAGIALTIGGAGIALVAQTLIPMLANVG